MATLERWLADIPSQFCNKKNIEIMIRAFSKQIDELLQVFDDLKSKTTLENATGQTLKYIGDILSTSVKEAQSIVRMAKEQEITDEMYRKVLKYKAIKNNCDCTYYDIMDSFALLWDISHVKYVEKLEKPATICIELPQTTIDGKDPAVERVLAIRPAGVGMIYFAEYVTEVNLSGIEKAKLSKIRMAMTGINLKELFCTSALVQGMIEKVEESILSSALIRGNIETMETSIMPHVFFRGSIENEESMVSSALIQSNIKNEEESLETIAIFYKSYWLLDGMYRLDGTKILAAEKWEEVL